MCDPALQMTSQTSSLEVSVEGNLPIIGAVTGWRISEPHSRDHTFRNRSSNVKAESDTLHADTNRQGLPLYARYQLPHFYTSCHIGRDCVEERGPSCNQQTQLRNSHHPTLPTLCE